MMTGTVSEAALDIKPILYHSCGNLVFGPKIAKVGGQSLTYFLDLALVEMTTENREHRAGGIERTDRLAAVQTLRDQREELGERPKLEVLCAGLPPIEIGAAHH